MCRFNLDPFARGGSATQPSATLGQVSCLSQHGRLVSLSEFFSVIGGAIALCALSSL